MTVYELATFLNELLAEGKGDMEISGQDIGGFNVEIGGVRVYDDDIQIERKNLWE